MLPSITGNDDATYTRSEARRGFDQWHQRGWCGQLGSKVTGRRHAPLSLNEVQASVQVRARSHAGVQSVPIERIRGSEGRCKDFDADFRPLKSLSQARWVSIACARQSDVPLPLVELIQVNDTYYVRDGHHRVSVARWLGQQEIEAEVTVWHCRAIGAPLQTQATTQPADKATARPVHHLPRLLAKAGERLLTMLQRAQPLASRMMTQGG